MMTLLKDIDPAMEIHAPLLPIRNINTELGNAVIGAGFEYKVIVNTNMNSLTARNRREIMQMIFNFIALPAYDLKAPPWFDGTAPDTDFRAKLNKRLLSLFGNSYAKTKFIETMQATGHESIATAITNPIFTGDPPPTITGATLVEELTNIESGKHDWQSIDGQQTARVILNTPAELHIQTRKDRHWLLPIYGD